MSDPNSQDKRIQCDTSGCTWSGQLIEGLTRCPDCNEALKLPQAAQAVDEAIGIEAVAEVKLNKHGFGFLDWLIEGGIAALPQGTILVVSHKPITDDDGHGEVYVQRAPAIPASNCVTLPRDEIELALEALESAQNGLRWYQAEHPKDDSTADDECHQQIDQATAHLNAALATHQNDKPKVRPFVMSHRPKEWLTPKKDGAK